MQIKTLLGAAKIINRITNPSSLTSLYRSVELGPAGLRCASEFGNIEIWLTDTGIAEPVLLDAASFAGVLGSLSPNSEIELKKTETKVNWKCSSAKGHWNLVVNDHAIPKIEHDNFPWEPSELFPTALLLASSACQAAAVSVGLYGILGQVDGENLRFLSSNSISLAATTIPKGTFPVEKITLRPPVPSIIATLLSACPKSVVDVTEDGIFMMGEWYRAQLPLGAQLDHDLIQLADQFKIAEQTAEVDSSAVKKFITRAKSLADRNASFTVNLRVEEGRLILEHSSMASSTEEYFLAAGLDQSISYKSVSLPADMLILPLEAVNTVVLDYLKDERLVLKGANPEFTYVVSGGA